jgi:hypothetical protein
MSTFVKTMVLFFFFGTMLFFVACKAGMLNKKEDKPAPPVIMGGSKSAVIIPAKKDSTKPKVQPHIYSSKSGRVFEPEENVDTTAKEPNAPTDPK